MADFDGIMEEMRGLSEDLYKTLEKRKTVNDDTPDPLLSLDEIREEVLRLRDHYGEEPLVTQCRAYLASKGRGGLGDPVADIRMIPWERVLLWSAVFASWLSLAIILLGW